jgi:DNA-binding PadR family transcriptional regulator
MQPPSKRSTLALAILVMLYEEPMHPYRMQQLIRERGKDEVINVRQRAGLYQMINRLEREAMIAAWPMDRTANRPARTVYELTTLGRRTVLAWMREILSTPAQEFPEFPAAISFIMLLTPEDARKQLEKRTVAVKAEVERIDALLKSVSYVPRLFLLEIEYLRLVHATELQWVRAVLADLRSERLTWSKKWLREAGAEIEKKRDATTHMEPVAKAKP